MISTSRAAALALAMVALGCSSSPVTPPGDNTVESVTVAPATLQFDALGVTSQLEAQVRNADDQLLGVGVTWSVANGNAVTVSQSGLVTAVANGTATVRATAGGKSTDVAVVVTQVPTELRITSSPTTFTKLGSIGQFQAAVVDRNDRPVPGTPITWSTDDARVVSINDQGVAVAAGPGTTTITATAGAEAASTSIVVSLIGPVGPALVGAEVPCTGGFAGPFPCNNVKLMSYVPLGGVGSDVPLNDIWGWVDPQTNREYAIVMRRDGTAFVDVTDPLRPAYKGFLPIPAGANPNTWHDVKVYANHAFIVADGAGPHGIQVFDLTTLRTVTAPRTFDATTRYTNVASAHNIFINEATGFAYSVGGSSGGTTCGGGLHMVNIQNPGAPTFAGCFADPLTGRLGTGYTHDVQCVIYTGPDATYTGKEICFGSNETAISISNVTVKSAPVAISRATYPGVAYTHQGWLTPDQKYFLVNDELDEGQGSVAGTRTLIWDVTDLDDPVLVSQYIGPTMATDHNHYIRGNRMFMSNYQFGLRVVDVTNPVAPTQIGFFDTAPELPNTPGFGGSWSNYPFFPSGNIVMTSSTEGFFVLRAMN